MQYWNTLSESSCAPTVAVVKMITLPDLQEGGDFVDWIDAHGDAAEIEGMRAEIEALAAVASSLLESTDRGD